MTTATRQLQHLFSNWCTSTSTLVANGRNLHQMTEISGARQAKKNEIVSTVHSHYEDPQLLADRIKRLGFTRAGKVLEKQFPKTKKARSGHIGEIMCTECVPAILADFIVPIKRLRWLDGRESALRGEDLIGISLKDNRRRFVKGESKSGISITASTISKARKALLSYKGRPSPHSMTFVMKRLFETGQDALAIIFEEYVADNSIAPRDLVHLMFTLTGNDPSQALVDDLRDYTGMVEQHSVNVRIVDHQKFIKSIYT